MFSQVLFRGLVWKSLIIPDFCSSFPFVSNGADCQYWPMKKTFWEINQVFKRPTNYLLLVLFWPSFSIQESAYRIKSIAGEKKYMRRCREVKVIFSSIQLFTQSKIIFSLIKEKDLFNPDFQIDENTIIFSSNQSN